MNGLIFIKFEIAQLKLSAVAVDGELSGSIKAE